MSKKTGPSTDSLVLDFGHTALRLVITEGSAPRPRIKNFTSVVFEAAATDQQKREILKKAVQSLGFTGDCALVTWEEGMTFRQLTLPAIPKEDFRRAVLWELKEKFSVNEDTHLIGWETVFETETEGAKEQTLAVFHCDKQNAMEKIGLVQSLGVRLLAVIPSQAALAGFAGGLETTVGDVLLFDIGYGSARILVARDRKNMLSRTVPSLGGQSLTQSLGGGFFVNEKKVTLSAEEAEKLKTEEGARDPQAAHISVLRPYLDKMVAEIKRSVDYYEGQKYSGSASKVLFTGGGANLKGLREFMTGFLGMEVIAPNAEEYCSTDLPPGLKPQLVNYFPAYIAALGAAGMADHPLNLVPREIKFQQQEMHRHLSLRMALIASSVLLSALVIWTWVQAGIANTQLKAIETEWREIHRMDEVIAQIATDGRVMRAAMKGDMLHAALLTGLSRMTPNSILLDEIQFNREQMAFLLRGTVNSSDGKGVVKIVAQLTNELIQSPFFIDASFRVMAQEPGVSSSHFEIAAVPETT